jgi:multidrug transporter EmrE-like cation transporter
MAWLFILIADMFEVAWPCALKWSVKLGIREQRNIILSSA